MNMLCLGGRTVGPAVAWDLVQAFLAAEFSHAARHCAGCTRWLRLRTIKSNPTRTESLKRVNRIGERLQVTLPGLECAHTLDPDGTPPQTRPSQNPDSGSIAAWSGWPWLYRRRRGHFWVVVVYSASRFAEGFAYTTRSFPRPVGGLSIGKTSALSSRPYSGSPPRECHKEAYDSWADSNHGMAERLPFSAGQDLDQPLLIHRERSGTLLKNRPLPGCR